MNQMKLENQQLRTSLKTYEQEINKFNNKLSLDNDEIDT